MATIEARRSEDGTLTYRVKVRLKGHPTEHASFRRKTDAQRWAQSIESAIREGRHFKTSESKRHTLEDLIGRYLTEVLPDRPRNAVNTRRHLAYWQTKLGKLTLADITSRGAKNTKASKHSPAGFFIFWLTGAVLAASSVLRPAFGRTRSRLR